MRWKLLIIASLAAALIGAGGVRLLVYWTDGLTKPISAQPTLLAGSIIIPLVFAVLASVFVYRHTARRRKLQAALTALLSLVLTLAALFAAQVFIKRPPADASPPARAPQSLG